MMDLGKRMVRVMKMMDINLINTPKNSQPKTNNKQTQSLNKGVSRFEDSLNTNLNNNLSKDRAVKEVENKDLDNDQISQITDEDDIELFLKNIDALLSLFLNDNPEQNNLDLKIINNMDFSVEGIEGEDSLLNIEDTHIQNILMDIGISQDQIDSNNITYSDIIDKVVENSDTFKASLRKEINNLVPDNDLLDDLIGDIDEINVLDSKDMLNNIKNEIKHMLNKSVGNNTEGVQNLNGQVNHLNNLDNISVMNNAHLMRSREDNSVDSLIDKINNQDIGINPNIQFDNVIRSNSTNLDEVVSVRVVNRVELVNDFIESLDYMSTNNKTEMIVKVNPDHLGKMDIKYEVVKDQIRLNIKIENRDVAKMMESVVQDIKSIIKETHSINLDNIHVNLEQSTFGYNEQRENSQNRHNDDTFKINSPNIRIDEEENIDKNNDLKRGILV